MLYANTDCRIPQGCMLGLVLLNTASGMHQVRRSCSMAVIGLPFGDLAGWRNARCLLSIIRPPQNVFKNILCDLQLASVDFKSHSNLHQSDFSNLETVSENVVFVILVFNSCVYALNLYSELILVHVEARSSVQDI